MTKPDIKIISPLVASVVAIGGISNAATVVLRTATSGVAPSANLLFVSAPSNGSARQSGIAPPANLITTAYVPEISGTPSNPQASEASSGSRAGSPNEQRSASSNRKRRTERVVPLPPGNQQAESSSGDSRSAKGAEVPQIAFEDPGAFRFSAEAGYASKHLWRGIDLAQFTSANYALPGDTPKADSDVTFIGANATYKGFAFGLKYIETIDESFNPFFAIADTDLDSYQEFVVSLNYTRMLWGTDLLQGTAGFDFYYYPNDEFWGVENQGMLYTRLSSPHYKWAQPFLEVFYNVAIDSDGSGLADEANFVGGSSIRGADGADLVEGGGFEIGVNGGDSVYSNGAVSLGLTYSLSSFYKTGYQFEDDGFSHVSLTLGAPISIGTNLTITPSVSYVEALGDISDNINGGVNFGGNNAAAWNEPGWVASIKASWQF